MTGGRLTVPGRPAGARPVRSRSSSSLRYSLDALNRLIVEPADALTPRQVLAGRLTTDRTNRLVYEVEMRAAATLRRLVLDGAWTLTPDHELELALHETEDRQRRTLHLKGALIQAEAHALAVALDETPHGAERSARRVTLSGRWQADAQNRLSFLVRRADGDEDRLTLQGAWEVGPHHELLYRYRRPGGGLDNERTLIFQGAWDITGADRLVYRVAGSNDSVFEFRASLRSPSVIAQEGRIVYEVGVAIGQGRTERRRIALFGAWKLNRDLSVSFEIPYADGRAQAIRFEGAYTLSGRDRVAVALRAGGRENLGLSVTFTRRFVRDANLFLRLQKTAEETSAIAGVQVRF